MKGVLPISNSTLTLKRVREMLNYNPDAGILTWLKKAAKNTIIGNRAGSQKSDGYRYLRLDNIEYLEHRLIWFGMTGEWPENNIDHEDLNKSNNKWNNLRKATVSQNTMNTNTRKDNKVGCKGIDFFQNKFRVRIQRDGKELYLGSYSTLEEAVQIRNANEKFFHGEFARTGMLADYEEPHFGKLIGKAVK